MNLNKDEYTLVRIESQANMMDQYYLWQANETERDKYCFEEVYNYQMSLHENAFLKFRMAFEERTKENGYYILVKKVGNTFIGTINLLDYNPRNQTAVVSYYLPPENRHKGFGTIMMSLFLDIVFADEFFWKLHKIYAETGSFNTPSIKLLEHHGFHLDGRIRDHYWFGEDKYDQLEYTLLRFEYMDLRTKTGIEQNVSIPK